MTIYTPARPGSMWVVCSGEASPGAPIAFHVIAQTTVSCSIPNGFREVTKYTASAICFPTRAEAVAWAAGQPTVTLAPPIQAAIFARNRDEAIDMFIDLFGRWRK